MTQFPVSLRGDEERVYQALWGKGVIGFLNHKGSMEDMEPMRAPKGQVVTQSQRSTLPASWLVYVPYTCQS